MLRHEFKFQMDRLVKRFKAENVYTDEVMDIFFQKFGDIHLDHFAEVVDKLIIGKRQAPLYSDFMEATAAIRKEMWDKYEKEIQAKVDALPDCGACGKSGTIKAHDREEIKYSFAFRCGFCETASLWQNYRKLDVWDRESHKYYIQFYIPRWDDMNKWPKEIQDFDAELLKIRNPGRNQDGELNKVDYGRVLKNKLPEPTP